LEQPFFAKKFQKWPKNAKKWPKKAKNAVKSTKTLKNDQKNSFFLCRLLQGHRIAQIAGIVRHPAAVEADEGGFLCDFHDLVEFVLAGQQTDMPLVIPRAYQFMILHMYLHDFLISPLNLQS